MTNFKACLFLRVPSFLSYDYQRTDACFWKIHLFLKVHKLWYVLEPVSRTERHGMVGRGKCQEKIDEHYGGNFFVDSTCINCDACRQLAPTFREQDDIRVSTVNRYQRRSSFAPTKR